MSVQAIHDSAPTNAGSAKDDSFNIGDRIEQGMQRLAAISQELGGGCVDGASGSDTAELARLRQDNAELRMRIDDLERASQEKETAMAKNRVELARQRKVILRLHQELNAALEPSHPGQAACAPASSIQNVGV
jgi:hypothetical protein